VATVTERSDEVIAPGGKVDPKALERLYAAQQGDDDTPVTVRFRLGRDVEKRLDLYLTDRIPFLSRTSLQRLIREDAVTVNGRRPKASTKLRRGDEIVAVLPPPPSSAIPAEEIPLRVIHEDEDLVVIDKQADILVHPARGHRSGTMINALAWHFQHASGGALSSVGAEDARPGVVHRLDRHTTGVIAFAKSEPAHWLLARQFAQRTAEKRYLTVVHGDVRPDADVIDAPVGPHPTEKHRYAVRWGGLGKEAVTIFRVRERYEGFTLLEIELKTGRTHQIRVHLTQMGWPLAGDDLYGGRHLTIGDVAGTRRSGARSPRDPLITRQALHAALLSIRHPGSGARVTYTSPLPPDMAGLVTLLRAHRLVERPTVAGTLLDVDEMLRR
jgi:23S rRNA pseudouridine1911/1915/1917 synthase